MTLDADMLLERRRLKRRLSLWRAAAVAVAVGLALLAFEMYSGGALQRAHVARIQIDGVITEDPWRDEALAELAEDPAARAVLVHISSPGGTTYGGEQLYRSLRRIGEHKPVVAVIGTIGASGGYMAALAADRIIAGESSITGSIGVLFQATEVSGLMEKLGVSSEAIRSGPLKAEPNPFEPMSDRARAATQALVDETHRWFTDMVAERRGLSADELAAVTDGRIFIGRGALAEKLVDQLGGEREARNWLAATHGIGPELPVRDIDWRAPTGGLGRLVGEIIGKAVLSERLTLDGLVSLWHPDGQ